MLRQPTTNARRCALLAWWVDSGYHNLDIIAARCGYEIKNHTMPWLMQRRVRLLRWKYCNKKFTYRGLYVSNYKIFNWLSEKVVKAIEGF